MRKRRIFEETKTWFFVGLLSVEEFADGFELVLNIASRLDILDMVDGVCSVVWCGTLWCVLCSFGKMDVWEVGVQISKFG